MDKKKLLLLVAALLIAVTTAFAARSVFSGGGVAPTAEAVPVAPVGPKVLVAQRALPTGTIITADSVSFQDWPKELVQDAYFLNGQADMSKLLGTVVRYPVPAGQPLTQGALVAPGDRGFLAAALGPGMRAITIPVSDTSGVGGFVFPGDRVDLMLTQSVKSGADQELKAAETILRNVRVLATDQATASEIVEGKSVVKTSRTVTLEVTPRIAEKISVAETVGQLSLSLRPLADNQADFERVLASGDLKVPEGATKEQEDQLMRQAMNHPIEGSTTFVTGGDVSRFQPSRYVPPSSAAPAAAPMMAAPAAPGAPAAAYVPRPSGPMVRVTRGKTTTAEAAGK
ncbi:pilus assembly protein CpaB [Novosphingobium chloroacetimidivorans]|uniref:Pilus assembly protein CpaB n=1 Tax=Novosphingobium chloroacetimidivorans TaxID=1428314 RepID=A0A7W7NY96_9SPHN|nr:Flp pilus assembly protein CpaB [Novosphingobium chloroacetimidivorans]MBB4860239.1 pilus assembly protein CpaB [Novosphingobium chloroacetimidivorans]